MSEFDITKKLAERVEMLEATYKQYINLLQMIDVFVDQGILEDKVTITVVKKDMVEGKTWKEILTAHLNAKKEVVTVKAE